MVGRTKVIDIEEELVLDDRAADPAAEIVVGHVPYSLVEVGSRIKSTVLHVLGCHTVKFVRAGIDDHIAHSADGTAQFGFKVTGRDVHCRNGLYRWNQNLQEPGPLIIVDALNLKAVALAGLAVHLRLD